MIASLFAGVGIVGTHILLKLSEVAATVDKSETGKPSLQGTLPPLTLHSAPVTFEAASEQRNTATAAISSGSA